MNRQILLIALISISLQALSVTNKCECTELVQQADCTSDCTWSTTDSTCNAKTSDCTTLTSQSSCDLVNGCAWTDSTSKCDAFTACSNYSVTVADQCNQKDSTCVSGTSNSDGTIPCQTGSITCSTFTSSTDCNFKVPNSTSKCYYTNNQCSSIDVSKCSTITVQEICEFLPCKWTSSSNTCAAQTCSDLASTANCKTVSLDDFSGVNICTWSGQACTDAVDVTALSSTNCYSSTSGYYYWNGSACTECSGSSSYSYVLAFIGFIMMVMF
ncbi:unnamed protein product [Paramecium sonneborni]|uniref:Uncharacterized protein n=1 Tax=Paramecium sonneborni TaxID=65129 RepID=A0A8S1L5A3_9CILI|nr:unnamed protein product [Paramecium sonneborni]